jgi:hypothetical protein
MAVGILLAEKLRRPLTPLNVLPAGIIIICEIPS